MRKRWRGLLNYKKRLDNDSLAGDTMGLLIINKKRRMYGRNVLASTACKI